MFAQRYALIHQRLLRNELFRPQDLTRNSAQHKLTPIESLLGKTQDQTLLLLGMLLQIEEGQWYLEDPTGQVPISFQSALAVDGFFVTEQCVLLVEGYFHDGTFYVLRLGQPLLEDRDVSMAAIRQQVSHPAYAVSPSSSSLSSSVEQAPALVLLSDVHLDQPRVAQQLEGLFATYEPRPHSQLPLFVLMGNFSSSSTANRESKHWDLVRDYLASGSRDRTVRLWKLSEGTCLATFAAHENWVRAVLVHPGGKYVLSASDDKSIRVFDVANNRCLRVLEKAHDHFVTSLAIHPTLPVLVSGGVDRTVRCWQLD